MTVLVAYDGSLPAQKAVEHAIEQFPDETIVLLRVVEIADGYTDAGIGLLKEHLRERRKEVATDISDDVASLIDVSDVEFEIETTVGRPAREVVEYAEKNDVDQIIVGSHGRAGVSRVLLGSVAEEIVRRSSVPVTVVR